VTADSGLTYSERNAKLEDIVRREKDFIGQALAAYNKEKGVH